MKGIMYLLINSYLNDNEILLCDGYLANCLLRSRVTLASGTEFTSSHSIPHITSMEKRVQKFV